VSAAEEVAHGLCEIPQCLLLHGLTSGTKSRVLSAGLTGDRLPPRTKVQGFQPKEIR
jgi:hypothetical protein